ncbi:MAG: hypothetical protein JXA73_26040 [Acidobacteria bacterium]|nr:hypothetical protein [Acidobacteriota bacterium]
MKQKIYRLRKQTRPAGGIPDKAPDAVPNTDPFVCTTQRGPWKAFFADNKLRTTIINTYNAQDSVLNVWWKEAQILQKPYVGFLGLGWDSRYVQYWASLSNTGGDQETIWSNDCSNNVALCQHSNIIRQWAELAYWFRPLSVAAGTKSIADIQNIEFTGFGESSSNPTPSHSYLKIRPFSVVFDAWSQIAEELK